MSEAVVVHPDYEGHLAAYALATCGASTIDGPTVRHFHGLRFDMDRAALTATVAVIKLSRQQGALLERLTRRPGAIVQTRELIEAIYADGDDEPDTAIVVLRLLVGKLRKALALLGKRAQIVTENRIGYSLQAGEGA